MTTASPPRGSHDLFGPRTLRVFVMLGILSLSATLWALFTDDPLDAITSKEQDTFSRSAIGHHGAMTWLQTRGIPTTRSTYRTAESLAYDPALLVLIEPLLLVGTQPEPKRVLSMKAAMAQAPATLVVLPKWQKNLLSSPSDDAYFDHADIWIQSATRTESSIRTHALARINVAAQLTTSDLALVKDGWQLSHGLVSTPSMPYVQLLATDTAIEPIIWNTEGILLGRTTHPVSKRPLFVLSDPDLLSNHGLEEGENAALMVEIFQKILLPASGTGKILIDETIHGYFIPPTLLQHMRRRPLLYLSLHLLLMTLFLLWAGVLRFGRPRPHPTPQATGTHYLLEHTAQLMTLAGDPRHSVEHYVVQTIREVGKRLRAPHHLSLPQLIDWLEATTAERHLSPYSVRSILELATDHDASTPQKGRAVLLPAVRIFQWKRSVLL